MSDATANPPPPESPPPETAPADEPIAHDGPTFVHNGIIRFPMGEQIVRVRRPFLGELKALRLALEQVQDDMRAESERVDAIGRGFMDEAREVQARHERKEITDDERTAELQRIGEADRRTARALDDMREQKMLDWWSDHVFGPLALDPVPDQMQWPMWMLDGGTRTRQSLVQKCLSHWRTTPTGPG